MPGMPWDDPSAAGTAGGALTPQQQLMWRLLMNRGTGGMQNLFGGGAQPGQGGGLANQLANSGQSGLMGMIMQNPQLLQWFMQQQQGGPGWFPQEGGGVNLLAQLLRAPQQAGQPT